MNMDLCWRGLAVVAVALGLALIACDRMAAQQAGPLGRLHWGADSRTGTAWTDTSLARAWSAGYDPALAAGNAAVTDWVDSGKSFSTVPQIFIAGYLPGDPRYDASLNALHQMKMLVPLALCARACAPDLRSRAQRSANQGVFAWMHAYAQPTGNPIDESGLLPLLLATDLLQSTWSVPQRAEAATWLKLFLASSDHYWQTVLNGPNNTPYSNFESWRLMLALLAAKIDGQQSNMAALTVLWHRQLTANLGTDGRTFDLRRRGSLHYQTYDLEPMLWVKLFVPEVFSQQEDELVLRAVMYLKPYVQGQQTYIEFAHPDPALGAPIAFDRTRRDAGLPGYQLKNWNPEDARLLLHLAGTAYPAVASWNVQDREAAYPDMVRLIVRLRR